MALKWLVSTFCVMPQTERINSLNLLVPDIRFWMIKTFYLSPINCSVISADLYSIQSRDEEK